MCQIIDSVMPSNGIAEMRFQVPYFSAVQNGDYGVQCKMVGFHLNS